jgi:molybdate transport system substrate-binding protein
MFRRNGVIPAKRLRLCHGCSDQIHSLLSRKSSRDCIGEGAIMTKTFANRLATALAGGLLFFPVAIERAAAEPIELTVMTSVALASTLDELAPQYEHATGNRLKISYSLVADFKKRILAGESADVIILSRAAMDDLGKQDKFLPGSILNVAGTPVAVVIRAGAAKPDISTGDALKRALLAAKFIVYADPAKGGLSGIVAGAAIDKLGIAEQMKSRTILVPGAQAADVVVKGLADIGIGQASEIVPVAGAELLGPLPGEFASTTLFTAGVGTSTKAPEAAKSLIQFLTGPVAVPVFKSKGFQPG